MCGWRFCMKTDGNTKSSNNNICICIENIAYFYDIITFSKLPFQWYFRNVIKKEEYQTQD